MCDMYFLVQCLTFCLGYKMKGVNFKVNCFTQPNTSIRNKNTCCGCGEIVGMKKGGTSPKINLLTWGKSMVKKGGHLARISSRNNLMVSDDDFGTVVREHQEEGVLFSLVGVVCVELCVDLSAGMVCVAALSVEAEG